MEAFVEMMPVARWGIAARMAWTLHRGQGVAMAWRRLALALAAVVAAGSLVLVAGLVQLNARSGERRASRSLEYVDESSPAAQRAPLRIIPASDTHESRQWTVLWVEPRQGAPLPPGLRRWPEPGAFAVSPGLARAIARTPALASRYSPFTVIGDAGVSDRGEWFAYARPAAGRSLGAAGAPFSSFSGGTRAGTERDPSTIVALAVAGAIGVPVALVLLAGVSAATPAMDRRAVLLARIGAPRGHLRRVSALEALLGSAPGAVVGGVVGRAVARHVHRIPFTSIEPVGSDLVVSVLAASAVVAAVLAVVAGWAGTRGGRGLDASVPRPVARPRWSRLALLPVAAGGALLATSVLGPAAAKPSAAATLLVMVGVPLAVPAAAAVAGRSLARSNGVVGLLAGRRIEADPTGAVRPLLGLAALVLLVLIGLGFVTANRSDDAPPVRDASLDAAAVLYADPRPGDLAALRGELPRDLVAPIDGDVVGVGCRALSRALPQPCDGSGRLNRATQSRLAVLLMLGPDEGVHLRLGAVDPRARLTATALVIGPSGSALSTRVEQAAGRHLVAPQVATADNLRPRASALWGWVLLGLASAALLLAIAVTLAMVDGVLRSASSHGVLRRLGVTTRSLARLELAQFAVAYAVTVGGALAFGSLNAWVMVRTAPTAEIPVAAMAGVVAGSGLLGVVGALGVWAGHSRLDPDWAHATFPGGTGVRT